VSRRTTGALLLVIAAFLYGVRYLSAAIFGSGITSWNSDLFQEMLNYVGTAPRNWSLVALILGLFYLMWAEYGATSSKTKESLKRFVSYDIVDQEAESRNKTK
jgi:H+/Cl- antiporter ClcA